MRGVTRTGSFGRVDTLRTSNPPSRSSSFSRGEKLPPSLQRLPPLSNTSATLPRDAERRSRSSGCGGDYVTVLEIGSSSGGGGTEVRSRTVPRTRPSGGYERTAGESAAEVAGPSPDLIVREVNSRCFNPELRVK